MRLWKISFIILLAVAWLPGQAPVAIDGIYPSSGSAGDTVLIKGRGFSLGDTGQIWSANLTQTPAPGFVEFNGLRAPVQLWQDNLIMVRVPERATAGFVRVVLRSGITVQGNHFELVNAQGESQSPGGRREYSFMEKDERTMEDWYAFAGRGLYPSPRYFYHGCRPAFHSRRDNRWELNRGWGEDGFLDFFLLSGPLVRSCGFFTGFDQVSFFPAGFHRGFNKRWVWWSGELTQGHGREKSGKRPYSFQER